MKHGSQDGSLRRKASYSIQEIAERYPDIGMKEVTIRTRWFEWLRRVAPEPLLKDDHRYTALAAELFDDFAQRVKRERMDSKAWVEDAKRRYAPEMDSEAARQRCKAQGALRGAR